MLSITPIPAFEDNYIWLLTRDGSQAAVIVDPGDAGPVLEVLRARGLQLVAILATHHHADHVGGVKELLKTYPGIPVYGPARESIPTLTERLEEGQSVSLDALEVQLQVLDVPGHTAGHIAYTGEGALFCGDTLFSVGCGRLFEGSPEQMYTSLRKLAALPGETRVHCAHEYTASNVRFALQVEADNPDLLERAQDVATLRQQGRPTLPTSIALERRTNPFLRTTEATVKAAVSRHTDGIDLDDPMAVFAALRRWKDTG